MNDFQQNTYSVKYKGKVNLANYFAKMWAGQLFFFSVIHMLAKNEQISEVKCFLLKCLLTSAVMASSPLCENSFFQDFTYSLLNEQVKCCSELLPISKRYQAHCCLLKVSYHNITMRNFDSTLYIT